MCSVFQNNGCPLGAKGVKLLELGLTATQFNEVADPPNSKLVVTIKHLPQTAGSPLEGEGNGGTGLNSHVV